MKTLIIIAAAFLAIARASDADNAYQAAMATLRAADADHQQLIPAIKQLSAAAGLFEKEGNDEKATVVNSCLYWAKKKLTLEDVSALKPSAETVKRLDSATAVSPASKAKPMLERTDTFAKSHPEEHLLIAIQYFEVADRFPATDEGRRAMAASLASMQKVNVAGNKPPAKASEEVTIDGNLIFTQTVGAEGNKKPFVTEGTIVIGFRYSVNGKILSGIQPICLNKAGKNEPGKPLGKVGGKAKEVVAKNGYAVGGVLADGEHGVKALQVLFMRIEGTKLNPNDSYKSEWLVKQATVPEKPKMLGGSGEFVVGTYGWGGSDVDCFGLALKKADSPGGGK